MNETKTMFDGSDQLAVAPAAVPAVIDNPPAPYVPHNEPPRSTALADLRQNAMALDVTAQRAALTEYAQRRASFYEWLLQQLEQGVHYGVPPGIKPSDADPRRWKAKPSLYKAGADFICDLMGLRDEYAADMATWEMLGKPSDTFIRRCRLVSRVNGELVGEGTGARKNGTKSMDVNGSIKMADKCAKVAAIINTYGLSDLFTQDIEDLKEQYESPEQRGDAPQHGTRAESYTPKTVTQEQMANLLREWKSQQQGEPTRDDFAAWCRKIVPEAIASWNPNKLAEWTPRWFERCCKAVGMP